MKRRKPLSDSDDDLIAFLASTKNPTNKAVAKLLRRQKELYDVIVGVEKYGSKGLIYRTHRLEKAAVCFIGGFVLVGVTMAAEGHPALLKAITSVFGL